jgi:hypothetical protein
MSCDRQISHRRPARRPVGLLAREVGPGCHAIDRSLTVGRREGPSDCCAGGRSWMSCDRQISHRRPARRQDWKRTGPGGPPGLQNRLLPAFAGRLGSTPRRFRQPDSRCLPRASHRRARGTRGGVLRIRNAAVDPARVRHAGAASTGPPRRGEDARHESDRSHGALMFTPLLPPLKAAEGRTLRALASVAVAARAEWIGSARCLCEFLLSPPIRSSMQSTSAARTSGPVWSASSASSARGRHRRSVRRG